MIKPIRDLKKFEEGTRAAFAVKEIMLNPSLCTIINYTDDYYDLLCNLIEFADKNEIEGEVRKQLESAKTFLVNYHRGMRGDFDDLGDME